jgi:hypothetical protein
MGTQIYDKYSLLHLATGIIAYYFDMSLILWILVHTLFEILENTKQGIYFIDNYIKIWPGGKLKPDSILNSISDTIFGALGWILAYYHGIVFSVE